MWGERLVDQNHRSYANVATPRWTQLSDGLFSHTVSVLYEDTRVDKSSPGFMFYVQNYTMILLSWRELLNVYV